MRLYFINMKIIVTIGVILLFFSYSSSAFVTENGIHAIENKINVTIEKIRDYLKSGDPESGLPSFDPLYLEEFGFTFDNTIIKGIMDLYEFYVYGMTDFTTEYLQYSTLFRTLYFTLKFKELAVSGEHYSDLTLVNIFPIYGSGNLDTNWSKLKINGVAILNFKGETFSVSNLRLSLTLDEAKYNFTGLMENEPMTHIINAILTENVPAFINNNKILISNLVSSTAKDLINDLLEAVNNKETRSTNQIQLSPEIH